jgi:hypothetical protein
MECIVASILLLMYVHHGFHYFLSGHCPGLVDIHLGDESTSKDLKLLIIGVYHGIHPFLVGFHLGQHFFFQMFFAGSLFSLIFFRLVSVFDLIGFYFSQQVCHDLFHLHNVVI